MRFAPPKSAPPGSRKCAKNTEESPEKECYALTGWAIKPLQHDVALLRECLSDVPRRCSSATDRYSTSEPLIVRCATNRHTHKHTNNNNTKGRIGERTPSKDSGLDGLTDSGIDNMDSVYSTGTDNADSRLQEDEEFSDISESNDGSLVNDNDLLDNELTEVGVQFDTELDVSEKANDVTSEANDFSSEANDVSSEAGDVSSEAGDVSLSPKSSNTLLENPPVQTTSFTGEMEQVSISSHLSRTSLDNNAFMPRNKRKVKKGVNTVKREHQIPNSVTPEKPEVSASPRHQPWSRTRKLERSSTTPSVCSYTDMVYDGTYKKEPSPEQYLVNPFEYLLHANRPQCRPEKRRSSLGYKSSCSIPSFSTPSQALLLIGMKPSKPQDTVISYSKNSQRRGSPHKPPLMGRSRGSSSSGFELPALTVNGAGDLVIRKKQIITG